MARGYEDWITILIDDFIDGDRHYGKGHRRERITVEGDSKLTH